MTKSVVTLDDKYTQDGGQVMLSALQGVVRLLLDQSRRDRAAGLKTAGGGWGRGEGCRRGYGPLA